MYKIHGLSHTWEGLEACTYGPSCIHWLKYGQLKPHSCGEQITPKPRARTRRIRPDHIYLVWAQSSSGVVYSIPIACGNLYAVCSSRLEQRCCLLYDVTLGKADAGQMVPVAVCNLPQQTAVGSARFKIRLLNTHHPLQS